MLAPLCIALAVFGVVLGVVVLFADARRWDNRFFAATVFADAAMAATRGVFLLLGRDLLDPAVMIASQLEGVLLCYACLQFAHAFPFNRLLSRALQLPVLLGAVGAVVLVSHPATRAWYHRWCNVVFYLPYFGLTLVALYRNWREVQSHAAAGTQATAGIPWIMLGVAFRWTTSMFAFTVVRRVWPDLFGAALWFDATGALFIGNVLISVGVLRYNLFRLRGAVALVGVYGVLALSVLGIVGGAIDVLLRRLAPGAALSAALVGVSLLPVAVFAIGRWLRPRLEDAILAPIAPGRVAARAMLERTLRGHDDDVQPKTLLDRTLLALSEMSCGGAASFLKGPAFPTELGPLVVAPTLPPALATHLASTRAPHLHAAQRHELAAEAANALDDLHADLLVPVRRGVDLLGALAVRSNELDRDLVTGTTTLAQHLALKLENMRLIAQTLALQSELEESRRLASLGAFAAAIAHDIRTPLTSIQMNVQILRGKVALPPDDMEYFDIALDELKRLGASITEMLDYAKPVQLATAPVPIDGLADDATRRLQAVLEERHVSIERRFEDGLPPVLADALRLRQVVMNLLDNAAQASDEGSAIVVRTRRAEPGRVALEVQDSGRGIAGEHLAKIFEPFFTTRPDGTGLGLAIAHKLVKAHGGELRVASELGHGSVFTILLPTA